VDSASTTAAVAAATLEELGLINDQSLAGTLTLRATDGATRFARVGGRFLGQDLTPEDIQIVDL
jgi:glutamate racemase